MIRPLHSERHFVDRIGWLRAAVLGANDGIVSTASLIVGVAAAAATRNDILIAAVAGLVAGAMSMAAGEYVSVSSQSDTETAELARERKELAENVEFELDELTTIYIKRGVEPALARQVAQQLMAKDALMAHARDEPPRARCRPPSRPPRRSQLVRPCRCSWLSCRLRRCSLRLCPSRPWVSSPCWARSGRRRAVPTSCAPPPGWRFGEHWPWP